MSVSWLVETEEQHLDPATQMSEKVQVKGTYGAITLTICSSQQTQPLSPLCALGSLPRHTCHLEAQAHFSQITPGTVFTAVPPSENWLHWLSMFLRFLLVLMHRRQFLLFGPSMVLKHIPFFLGILSEKVRFSLSFNPRFEPKDMICSQ